MEIVAHETEVHEAPTRDWGLGPIREELQEAISAEVEVHEHQRSVRVVQPERLADAKGRVEAQRALEIVYAQGGMAEVGEHRQPK